MRCARAPSGCSAGTFFVCGASTNGLIGTHLIAACHDYGIPQVRSAQLLAMMGIFDIIGTTASGWLTDRYSSRHLLFGYYTLRGLSLLYLPFTLQHGAQGLGVVRRVLRPRLDRDRAADGAADQRGVRPREHRRHLRLDWREPSARRVAGGVRRRRHPHRVSATTSWRSGSPARCACSPALSFLTIGRRAFRTPALAPAIVEASA